MNLCANKSQTKCATANGRIQTYGKVEFVLQRRFVQFTVEALLEGPSFTPDGEEVDVEFWVFAFVDARERIP